MIESLQKYWRIYLGVFLVFAGGAVLMFTSSSVSGNRAQEQALNAEIEELTKELDRRTLTEADLEPEVKIIEQTGVHARDMGVEMVQVQKKLADAYRTSEPVVNYEDKDGLKEAEKAYTRLTESTDYVNTWFLNKTWDMTLDSVGTYAETQDIPIVFSMYTAKDDLAGVVRATYDSERDLLDDIMIDYTVNGYADESDVGGM